MILELLHVRTELSKSQEDLDSLGIKSKAEEEQYIAKFYLDLNTVIDFVEGRIEYQGDQLPCIYLRLKEEYDYTSNVLIKAERFKLVLEKFRKEKILTVGEYLNKVENEDNSESPKS